MPKAGILGWGPRLRPIGSDDWKLNWALVGAGLSEGSSWTSSIRPPSSNWLWSAPGGELGMLFIVDFSCVGRVHSVNKGSIPTPLAYTQSSMDLEAGTTPLKLWMQI